MCDNCEDRLGFNTSTCGGNDSEAADRYSELRKIADQPEALSRKMLAWAKKDEAHRQRKHRDAR